MKKQIQKLIPKLIGTSLNLLSLVNKKKAADRALDIFMTPRGGRIKDYQAKYLKAFHQEKVKSPVGGVMTYKIDGQSGKPTVLLCHGWESNMFRWRKLVPHLEKAGFTIIGMDAPAHGASDGDRFTAILYREAISVVVAKYQPEIVIGHSMGCFGLLFYMAEYGVGSIQKMVHIAGPDRLIDMTDNYFNIIGGSGRLRKAYDDNFEANFHHPQSHFSGSNFAKKVNIPVLLFHAQDDDINLHEEGQRVHEALSDSRFISLERGGHSLQEDEVFQQIVTYCEA